MPEDVEKTTAWKYAGYPAFSSFAAASSDTFAMRRFAALNLRTLLKMQNDIMNLERELKGMDDYTKELPDMQGGCGSFRLDADTPREDLLEKIAGRLHEYNVRLGAYLTVADRPSATTQQAKTLRDWLANRPNAIEEAEQEFLSEGYESDLLAIRTPQRTHVGVWLEHLGLWRLAATHHSRGQSTTIYYDKSVFKTLGGLCLILSTLAFLLGPLWIMTFVRGVVTRLVIVTAFTIALSIGLLVSTTLKPVRRSAVLAGYFLIAVLLLGLSPAWSGVTDLDDHASDATATMHVTTITSTSVVTTQQTSSSPGQSQRTSEIITTISTTSGAPTETSGSGSGSSHGLPGGTIAGIVLGSLCAGALVIAVMIVIWRGVRA